MLFGFLGSFFKGFFMTHKILVLIFVFSSLIGCNESPSSENIASLKNSHTHLSDEQSKTLNLQFDAFKNTTIDDAWQYHPDYAVYVGYYKYDDKLIVPNETNAALEANFYQSILNALKEYDPALLSPSNATDHALLSNWAELSIWHRKVFKTWQWDPSTYNIAGVIGVILNTDYKPLDDRLLAIQQRMKLIPAYYQVAQNNIVRPTLEHTELGILQNTGALNLFNKRIPEVLQNSGLSADQQKSFTTDLTNSVLAINTYIQFLEDLKPKLIGENVRDFRIGEDLYEQKFALEIYSDFSAKELYIKALRAKDELHANMITISHELWPKYYPNTPKPDNALLMVKQLIDHLSVKHVAREDFVNEIRRQMPIIEQFIVSNDLLDTDPSRPLVVRETPEYQRGIAGASVNAPGPYDPTANTYYNVTPLNDYTDEQAESYLREYNDWILQILNIHEAMPGHYTQLVHANKSPSKIKSILGNGAMIEGWAVYSERMMLEQGYGKNEPEMWLMYSKWNLRVVANAIIDYGIQVQGWSKQEVIDILVNQAFQENTEATQKWRRATLSQVQLTSYYSGYAEIYEFRESLKLKMGDEFDLKSFHNKFLSYGNAPVPLIKRLMLEELGLAN